MQLAFDAADRLVELVVEHRAPVAAEEAARALYALRNLRPGSRASSSTASSRAMRGSPGAGGRRPRRSARRRTVESASYVFDLETTGLLPGADRIEIGAVRVSALALGERFQTLVNPGAPLPPIPP